MSEREQQDYLTDAVRRWKRDARIFVRELFGVTPDRWQDKALAIVSNPRTRRLALKACKGPGKTAVLAWIILWFLVCHVESKVGCTSINEGNIDSNLWPELLKWMNRSAFLKAAFSWSSTKVQRRGNANWFAVKRTWPKTGDAQQQADALAGIHADDVMFILDESGGIPQGVMVTAEAVLATLTEAMERAGHRALVVQSGNPTHTTGPLYRACTTERALWEVITITGDPDDPDRSPRISLKHAQEQIALWGRDNPWVMVNILGEFPPQSINSLLGVEEVERAMKRHYVYEDYAHNQKRLGVDAARFGDDRWVIFPRQGQAAFRPIVMRQPKTTQVATRIAKAYKDWSMSPTNGLILFDESGHWGHGAFDILVTAGLPVIGVLGEDKAPTKHYKNMRTYCWLMMADWVKKVGALPHLPEMIPELTEPTYTFIGGQFVLEPKDQIKARLGWSPDLADGLAETFALEDMPIDVMQQFRNTQKVAHEFEPFARETRDYLEAEGEHRADFNPFEYRRD